MKFRVLFITRYKNQEMVKEVARFTDEIDATMYCSRRAQTMMDVAEGNREFRSEWMVKSGRNVIYTSGEFY